MTEPHTEQLPNGGGTLDVAGSVAVITHPDFEVVRAGGLIGGRVLDGHSLSWQTAILMAAALLRLSRLAAEDDVTDEIMQATLAGTGALDEPDDGKDGEGCR